MRMLGVRSVGGAHPAPADMVPAPDGQTPEEGATHRCARSTRPAFPVRSEAIPTGWRSSPRCGSSSAAGQTGVDTDGRIGEDIEEQSRLLWRNIEGVLAGAGMKISDIAQLTMLLVRREDLPTARAVREEYLDGHRPASTLQFVAGLAHPDWLIEVDFVAARSSS